jgi:HEAT repeat protein
MNALALVLLLFSFPDDAIRAGVPEARRQVAVEMLTGLGEAALPRVEALSRSIDPIRRVAALEVWSNRSLEAGRYLPFLEDTSYAVRVAALEGIVNAEDGRTAWSSVVPLLEDPLWPVRRAAVRALAAHPEPGTAGLLFKALRDPDPAVQLTAIRFLDVLDEEIPCEAFEEAYATLSPRGRREFLEACPPLVRERNLPFFQRLAEESNTLARFACAGCTRDVPGDWIPDLIDQSFEGEARDEAITLLAAAGGMIVPHVKTYIEGGGTERTHGLVSLLVHNLKKEAAVHLASWVLDPALPHASREDCLEGLMHSDRAVLEEIYPKLDAHLQERAVFKAFGRRFEPVLLLGLENPDPRVRSKAFAGLCLLETPPMGLLIKAFLEEGDPEIRRSMVGNLVNVPEALHLGVAGVFCEEVDYHKPAALEAALHLPLVIVGPMREKAVGRLERMLDEGEEQVLVALMRIDHPGADEIVARRMERLWRKGQRMDYLVARLAPSGGMRTTELLHAMFQEADRKLRERILRVLVRRSDPAAADWMEPVFREAGVAYRRSILEDLRGSPRLAHSCIDLLRSILHQEKDTDILSTAVEASPPFLLAEEEDRLMELAGLGAETGMDTVEAVYRALARVGSERGLNHLHATAEGFIEEAEFTSTGPAMARLALQSLAEIRDLRAPRLAARFLFLHALAYREREILQIWDGTRRPDHGWARAVLSSLLLYDDETAQAALMDELERRKGDGSLYRCGDSLFGALCRDLNRNKRLPLIAAVLSDLTVRCAPARSPADFRVRLLRADRAETVEQEAAELEAAFRILKFYRPTKEIIRQELGDRDPYQGYYPAEALASDLFLSRAKLHDATGRHDFAEAARRRADQYSPFLER